MRVSCSLVLSVQLINELALLVLSAPAQLLALSNGKKLDYALLNPASITPSNEDLTLLDTLYATVDTIDTWRGPGNLLEEIPTTLQDDCSSIGWFQCMFFQ